MPETVTPAAPAPSAPAASAPSAPASSPAAVSAPAPVVSTPAAPVAPAPPTPVGDAPATPATPATPVKYDAETATAPPKPSDYSDTVEGQEQFMADNGKWSLLHPEEADKLNRTAQEAAVAPAEEAKPANAQPEENKPAEPAAVAATPAVIDEWTSKSPELKAAFEAHPELQKAVMEMARQNEAAAPVLAIVGTKEEAEFAVDHANRLVTLQSNWMLSAEDPEMVPTAYGQTLEFFKQRNEKGEEIKGPDGKPLMGDDFPIFQRSITLPLLDDLTVQVDAQINSLKASGAAEDVIERATYEKAAYDFLREKLKSLDKPESALPALPPGATQEQIAYQKQLEDREKAQSAKEGKQTTESRKAARLALDNEVGQAFSKVVQGHIDSHINAMKERGEYLPDFVLTDKWVNPQTQQPTKVTDFGARCWIQLNNKIYSNPIHKAKLADLQSKGAAGNEARQAELTRLTNLYLPKIIDTRVEEIQNGIRSMGKPKSPAAVESTGNNAGKPRVEPQSQATPSTPTMNDDQLMAWAQGEAKKEPGFDGMNAVQREEIVMTKYSQKKYFGV